MRTYMFLGLLFFVVSLAYEYPCTYKSKAGDFYDLSPLSKCDFSGYTVNPPSDGPFVLNICNDLHDCEGASVCQMGNFDCGHASSATFSDIDTGKGVVLTYKDGSSCPSGVHRQSILRFICDMTVTDDPRITFISEQPQCTYNFEIRTKVACPKPSAPQAQLCMTQVFLVPHTHDDVGWLMTVQDYYNKQVRNIIDTTLAALVANPKRKFIYVEQAYFTLWWNDQRTTDQQRSQMKQIVNEGRWEFVIGAWVMPDEACTTYGAVIDQMTLGHQFILNNFGFKPSKGWQIDPFGASSVTPVLEKLAGFDVHLIDRITDKNIYENSQRLEFMWEGSPSLGDKGKIFNEIMGGGGYCDWLGAFDFQNDPVNPSNVAQYGQKFVNMAQGRTSWYKTPNILAEWGCDFAFQNAAPMFHSMDQVVAWIQANAEKNQVNVSYSVLSEYYNAVFDFAKKNNVQWPNVDQGDYFPYLAGLWWTGYYTSRVELKGWVRRGEAVSHLIEPLYSLGRIRYTFDTTKAYSQINTLRVANGQAQHHDGVTGTSVPNVVLMFQNDIINGINQVHMAEATILNLQVNTKTGPNPNLVDGHDAVAKISNGQTVAVVLYNNLGWTRSDVVILPCNRQDLTVLDSQQNKVPFQIDEAVGGNITSKYHLFFIAKVGPLGYSTYFVQAPNSLQPRLNLVFTQNMLPDLGDTVIENSVFSVTISSTTNRISSITNKKSGITLPVDQNLEEYVSVHSGAYAFGPAGPSAPITTTPPQTVLYRGPVVTEVNQIFSSSTNKSYAKQTIRVFNANGNPDVEDFIEIAFDIGPLPSHREVITLFSTNINSEGIITTDDNGFEFLKREYQWGLSIEANYYPMIYASYINDLISQLSLISERSHGTSSQIDGDIEVMIHRNPDMGDGFGPGLTDTTEVYPSLRVILDTPQGSISKIRRQSYLMNYPLRVFSAVAKSPSDWINSYVTSSNLISTDLPSNVHFLSLNALDVTSKSAILRLTHLYSIGEDPNLSKPAQVNLSNLFTGVTISKLTETTLSANSVLGPSDMNIQLNPKDIRTFVVEFA